MTAAAARQWILASCLLLACEAVCAAQAEGGTVVFASGHSQLMSFEGKAARIRKGQVIVPGHIIRTSATGHVQIRFRDGTYVSLHPSTDLRVDAYRYHIGRETGEAASFTLYRGNARFMTGAIGKRQGSQFRVATAVAALELHGAEVATTLVDQLRVTVGSGRVDVRNDAGSLTAVRGQRVLVADRATAPLLIGSLVPYPVLPDSR
jgi:hypothetical protein